MSESVVVEAIKDSRDWNSPSDSNVKLTFYTLDIKRADGTSEEVDHARKQGGAEPQPGEKLEVIFENGKYRRKMKKAPQGGSAYGGGRPSKEWKPESERDPERSARILRQHSQSCAIAALTLAGYPQDGDWDTLKEGIREWTNWFDADVNAAGQAAVQGAGNTGSRAGATANPDPGPEPQPADLGESIQHLSYLLTNAGVADYPAGELAAFAYERLGEKRCKDLAHALKDPETQTAAVKGLRGEYKKAWGHEVREEPPTDDIPF